MKQILFSMAISVTLLACNPNGTSVSPDSGAARSSAVDSFGKGTVITADKLPQATLDYLTKTYPGYVFVQGVQGTDRAGATFFAAVIEQGGMRYHLHFDASGALVAGRGGRGGRGGPGPNDANETTITQDKLPQTIRDYLTATYAGYTFVGAQQAADAAGVVLYYEVAILQGGKPVRLNFDATGKLLERPQGGPGGNRGPGPGGAPTGTSITADKLPAAATTYLTANYAGYTFTRAEQVTTRDGVTLFAVAIAQNGATYFLLFNADGSFRAVIKKK